MVDKPFIGDEKRNAEVKDVARSNALMFMTEALSAGVIILILVMIVFLLK